MCSRKIRLCCNQILVSVETRMIWSLMWVPQNSTKKENWNYVREWSLMTNWLIRTHSHDNRKQNHDRDVIIIFGKLVMKCSWLNRIRDSISMRNFGHTCVRPSLWQEFFLWNTMNNASIFQRTLTPSQSIFFSPESEREAPISLYWLHSKTSCF